MTCTRKNTALFVLLFLLTACGDLQQQTSLSDDPALQPDMTATSASLDPALQPEAHTSAAAEDPALTPLPELSDVVKSALSPGIPKANQTADRLYATSQSEGTVRVIVGFKAPQELPEGFLAEGDMDDQMNPAAISAQRAAIQKVQDKVLSRISFKNRGKSEKFSTIPFMALEVDTADLKALLTSPEVDHIQEDIPVPPTLTDSVPLVGAASGAFNGYNGSGQTIAILDTGVATSHPVFSGKIVSEACYSSTANGSTTVCPNGKSSQTGTGSGINCSTSIYGCDHGTHVAAIAAGSTGVARGAKIIAIQVFSRFTSSNNCGSKSPCALTWSSDQIKALERVYALRTAYKIAAVNMSLGGGAYAAACDNNNLATKAAIDNLRSVGIATVIASGNDSLTDKISAPACISSAISVGATTKLDAVASYSNSSSLINLLAPGSSIYAAVPGSKYASKNGTSMATPHVAGAWAVLKSLKPAATVDEVLAALTDTGTSITDSRNGIAKPRIKIADALMELGNFDQYIADNKPDIYFHNKTTGNIGISYMDGMSRKQFFYLVREDGVRISLKSPWGIVTIQDLDGDGKVDLLLYNSTTGNILAYYMDGTTRKSASYFVNESGTKLAYTTPWKIAAVKDLNNDGKPDLLMHNTTTGNIVAMYMNGSARTAYAYLTSETNARLVLKSPWAIRNVTDPSGGIYELLLHNTSTGNLLSMTMNGAARTAYAYLVRDGNVRLALPSPWAVRSVQDLNGDSKADLLLHNTTTGNLLAMYMDGATRTSFAYLLKEDNTKLVLTSPWAIKRIQDLNNDGAVDLMLHNTSTGNVLAMYMNGATRSSYAYMVQDGSTTRLAFVSPWNVSGIQ